MTERNRRTAEDTQRHQKKRQVILQHRAREFYGRDDVTEVDIINMLRSTINMLPLNSLENAPADYIGSDD